MEYIKENLQRTKVIMIEQVGSTAGRIWDILQREDELTISQLPKALKQKDSLVYQALGWLAREGKIEYRTQGNKTIISLAREQVHS
jgi:Mn-dependent DtxR family transcriptional regulator